MDNMENELKMIYADSRQAWRQWLEANHAKQQSIWLVYYKKKANKSTVSYNDAVDEALCFGWIDSKAKPIDDEKYMQFFCPRKKNSIWSRINKEKVERLVSEGRMTKAGYESIDIAKQNGSWTILDEAEALIIPQDLNDEFKNNPEALDYFLGLSRSDKRNILQWLVLAKRQETKQKRINEIVSLAKLKQKPKQFR
jgi:uncharacterized protein YdeI (YjbR/CyaY-like superfamily)